MEGTHDQPYSDWEPLPTPTLSPFALARPGTFLRVGLFTAAVWCVPALRVPLVHSLINHFRQNINKQQLPRTGATKAKNARSTKACSLNKHIILA